VGEDLQVYEPENNNEGPSQKDEPQNTESIYLFTLRRKGRFFHFLQDNRVKRTESYRALTSTVAKGKALRASAFDVPSRICTCCGTGSTIFRLLASFSSRS